MHILKALRHGSHSFTCKLHHACKLHNACLSFVSVHQTAPPLTAVYYSFIDPEGMKGWDGLVGWPIADGLRLPTYRKWSSVSYTSSARQESSPAKDRCYTTVPRSQPWYAPRVSVQATSVIVSWGAVRNVNQSINQSTILGLRSHSRDDELYVTPRCGKCAFTFSRPPAWNSLPADLRTVLDNTDFKNKLKTHLLKLAFDVQ